MSEAKLKRYLKILYKDLNILREREAKYGGNAPIELLNQIEDHQMAIGLVETRLAGNLSDEQIASLDQQALTEISGTDADGIKGLHQR